MRLSLYTTAIATATLFTVSIAAPTATLKDAKVILELSKKTVERREDNTKYFHEPG
jgi:hypothetical protein